MCNAKSDNLDQQKNWKDHSYKHTLTTFTK